MRIVVSLLLFTSLLGCETRVSSPVANVTEPGSVANSDQPPNNARNKTTIVAAKPGPTLRANTEPEKPIVDETSVTEDKDSPAAVHKPGTPIGADKKLIGFACNTVEPAYLKEHVADIERLPLDGLNISVYPDDWGPQRSGQEGMFFGGRRFTSDDFRQSLADLKATPFKRFTDNFIQVETAGRGSRVTGRAADGNLDWFDPNWSGIVENGAVVARLARQAGFKGLFLDVEHYTGSLGPWRGQHIFNYAASPSRDKYTLQQTAAQVQLRGRQWMRAVSQAYPTITIIIIQDTGWHGQGLVEFFVRGMLEARGQATLIDGGESGYSCITHQQFAALRDGAEGTHAADKLLAPIEYAFGVWVDHTPNMYGGWHTKPADFHRNYRSPRELEHTLHAALAASDKYVWLYVWHPNVWFTPRVRPRAMLGQCKLCPHEKVPEAYVRALIDCRAPHDLNWAPPVAADRLFYFDDAVLVEGKAIKGSQKNLLDNPGFEQWSAAPDSQPRRWVVGGQGPLIVPERKLVKSGRLAARLTSKLPSGHVLIDMRLPAQRFAGKTITFGTWLHAGIQDVAGVEILDFVQGRHEVSSGGGHPGDGKWHFVQVTRAIRPDASGEIVLRLSVHVPFVKDAASADKRETPPAS